MQEFSWKRSLDKYVALGKRSLDKYVVLRKRSLDKYVALGKIAYMEIQFPTCLPPGENSFYDTKAWKKI